MGGKPGMCFWPFDNWISFTSLDTLSMSSGLHVVTSDLLILLFYLCVFFGLPSNLSLNFFFPHFVLCQGCICVKIFHHIFSNTSSVLYSSVTLIMHMLDNLIHYLSVWMLCSMPFTLFFFFHFCLDNFFYPIFKFTDSFLNCSPVCQWSHCRNPSSLM